MQGNGVTDLRAEPTCGCTGLGPRAVWAVTCPPRLPPDPYFCTLNPSNAQPFRSTLNVCVYS